MGKTDMPNRYIRESAIESEAVNSLSWHAEVFYRRLLNRVDDFGLYTANPTLLRSTIFPLQVEKVSELTVTSLLRECQNAGLVFVYHFEGKDFLAVNKWERGRALKSRYPTPDADTCKQMQTYVFRCLQMFPTPTPTPTLTPTPTNTEPAVASPKLLAQPQAPTACEKRFQKPTEAEVALQCAKIGLPAIEGEKFLNYYESNGWRVGKNPMKLWQRALTNWKLNWQSRTREWPLGTGHPPKTSPCPIGSSANVILECL
jgi:hypothetical protein